MDITAGGDFLGLCDQKRSYKHVSDFGRLRSYGNFLILIHALVWTASYGTSWRLMYSVAYRLRNLRRATRALHNRAAACVAAGAQWGICAIWAAKSRFSENQRRWNTKLP